MNLEIKPLKPDLLDDFLYYFDKIGFADNPDWSACYCHFFHFTGNIKEWEKRSGEENRNASIQLIQSEKMHGFLAYLDNKPVGWCNINSRENFAKSLYKYEDLGSREKKIAGIVCFLIAHTHRKQGIARQLLRYACSSYKEKGYDIIEAYPRKGKLSEAQSYHGPISLYISDGFSIYKEFEDFYVMRMYL
ncbi:MAG: GNAT family N-acetyltransferase [Promethearchaeota archaeon]